MVYEKHSAVPTPPLSYLLRHVFSEQVSLCSKVLPAMEPWVRAVGSVPGCPIAILPSFPVFIPFPYSSIMPAKLPPSPPDRGGLQQAEALCKYFLPVCGQSKPEGDQSALGSGCKPPSVPSCGPPIVSFFSTGSTKSIWEKSTRKTRWA